MDAVLHQVLAGLATGGIYASLALALVMIYQATHLVNFAQGEMAMFATYFAWSLINAGMPYWAAFFLTIAFAFVMGVLIERVIIRPVEDAPVLAVVVVFIALLVRELFQILGRINRDERVSMLLVEQNAAMALDLAGQAYLIETGRVVLSGKSSQLRDDEAVRRSYLGY